MNEHDECDHDGMYEVALPNWRFSLWDVAGITLHAASGIAGQIGVGLGLLARECAAAANNSRQTFDLRLAESKQAEAQAEIAADIARLVEGPGDGS